MTWQLEMLAMDSMPEGCLYARISPALLAVYATERAAIEFEASMGGNPERWFFAITDIHQALTSALVETLSGTNSLGALTDEQQKQWRRYHQDRRENPDAKPPEDRFRIASFETLLSRAKSNQAGNPLALTRCEESDLKQLNDLRNDLQHVKPTGWSLEIAGLPRILQSAAKTMHQLFKMDPLVIHLDEDELTRAINALDRFTTT